ncbi:M20 family metallopeptidase [Terrilactibacillus sp. S3-3]|nr:M20 family metallopeptidase [Terrilactibacillus sp. S3-3]
MIGETYNLNERVRAVSDEVVKWRRHLHENPELSFKEVETSDFVYHMLESFGNIELTRPTKTSVLGVIRGAKRGKTLAIRADMDALPIHEENEFEFISKNPGVMHACGHDGHTAMLLGAAKILSELKENLNGEVRLIFQHAEELPPGGAEELVQAGVMDGVDWVIGAHLWSPLKIGKIGITYGPAMAAPDSFTIQVIGKGGHAALPHQTIDSIAIAAQVVTNLQYIVSRNTDPFEPLVLSITKFVAGNTDNVIPNGVEIWGTVRSFRSEVRESAAALMERIIKGITEAHGAEYVFRYNRGYRPVVNDEETTQVVERVVRHIYGDDAIELNDRNMIGEDFSGYQQKAPGTFFLIGAGNPEKGITYPHHHARFTVDEYALQKGVSIFVHSAFEFLNRENN